MDRRQRRLLLCLTALAAVGVAMQALTGVLELALYLTPCLLIAALLLSGRFVAEERIVRHWRSRALRPVARPVRSQWALVSGLPAISLLERSPRLERGPPVPPALAA